jgi:MOSC domain-containing protein YiiM
VTAQVHQINTSPGGVPKTPVDGPVAVTSHGVEGDAHTDTIHHGGPDQALCLYSLDVIEALQEEGHPIGPGFVGENVTISGLDWGSLAAGDRIAIGDELVAELTWPATPCSKNAPWFLERDFRRMDHGLHPGWARWSARVLEPGSMRVGDSVTVDPAASAQ